jgi:hypothetical protein
MDMNDKQTGKQARSPPVLLIIERDTAVEYFEDFSLLFTCSSDWGCKKTLSG